MSFPLTAAGVKRLCPFSLQKRWTHRSPSYNYMHLWNQHQVDYISSMPPNMKKSPLLVSQILRAEAAMKQKGYVPFVHAMPASSKVLLAFYRAASPTASSFYKTLRSPFQPSSSLSEVQASVPNQEDRVPRPQFLSTSYALTGNTVHLESAASWGFVNHYGNEQYFPMLAKMADFAASVEEKTGRKIPSSFERRAQTLIRGYNRLSVGNFYVLGVPPEKIALWMYDAKPYHIPTGRSIEAVVNEPRLNDQNEGSIATLMLAKEVLHPASGLIAVEANNASEIESFCRGIDWVHPRDLPVYHPLMGPDTPFEEREKTARERLDQELDCLISDFNHWLKSSEYEEPERVFTLEPETGDYPPSLP